MRHTSLSAQPGGRCPWQPLWSSQQALGTVRAVGHPALGSPFTLVCVSQCGVEVGRRGGCECWERPRGTSTGLRPSLSPEIVPVAPSEEAAGWNADEPPANTEHVL